MDQRRLYVVRSVAKNGTVTYNCPTAEWALRKLRDFKAAERQDITVADPDGTPLTEAELIGIVEGSGSASAKGGVEAVPQRKRQPT